MTLSRIVLQSTLVILALGLLVIGKGLVGLVDLLIKCGLEKCQHAYVSQNTN